MSAQFPGLSPAIKLISPQLRRLWSGYLGRQADLAQVSDSSVRLAEREAKIEPDRVLYDHGWEAVASVR